MKYRNLSFEERQFRMGDLSRLLHLPADKVQVWQTRGLVMTDNPVMPGQRRLYSVNDAILLVFMTRLSALDLKADTAAHMAIEVQKWILEVIKIALKNEKDTDGLKAHLHDQGVVATYSSDNFNPPKIYTANLELVTKAMEAMLANGSVPATCVQIFAGPLAYWVVKSLWGFFSGSPNVEAPLGQGR